MSALTPFRFLNFYNLYNQTKQYDLHPTYIRHIAFKNETIKIRKIFIKT